MADITYSVEVAYLTKGNFAGPAMSRVGDIERRMTGATKRFGDSLGSSLNNAFSTFFAAETLTSVAHSFVDILKVGLLEMNAEVETMSMQWSTMFQAKGLGTFQEGMNASAALIKEMRLDAQRLPGEFKDLSAIFSRALTPGLNQGMSVHEIKNMSAAAMALGVGSGMKADVVGRELGDLIQGNMRKNMPILKVLPNFNIDTKEFNALSGPKRQERIQQALGMRGGQESIAVENLKNAHAKSWIGLSTTIKDNVKAVLGVMTYQLFNSIKDALYKVNQWYENNGPKIQRWAQSVGWYLARGFQEAVRYVAIIEPTLMKVGQFLKNELDSGKLFRDIEKMAGIAAALKVGGALAPLAGGAMKFAPELLGLGGSALGGIGGVAGAGGLAGLTAEGIIATGGALAGVLALVGAAMVAVYGAFEGIANEATPMNELMVELWVDIKEKGLEAAHVLAQAFHQAWPFLRRVSEIMGTGLLGLLDQFASVLLVVASGVKSAVQFITDAWDEIKKTFYFLPPEWLKPDSALRRMITQPEAEHASSRGLGLLDKHPPPTAPNHTTHIHHVEIKVNSNQDPSRIAQRTAEVLVNLARHPRTSSLNPNNQYAR